MRVEEEREKKKKEEKDGVEESGRWIEWAGSAMQERQQRGG